MLIKAGENTPLSLRLPRPRHGLLAVCRTPKAGSLVLRAIALAVATRSPFKFLERNEQPPDLPVVEDLAVLNATSTTRLAFVRHPVERIAAGYMIMQDLKSLPRPVVAAAFLRYINSTLRRLYDPTCLTGLEFSLNRHLQHVLPPQHCRCGMPWGIAYEIHHADEVLVQGVLSKYVDSRHLPPECMTNCRRAQAWHSTSELLRGILTPEAVTMLNEMTRIEQQALGYTWYPVLSQVHGQPSGHNYSREAMTPRVLRGSSAAITEAQ